MVDPEDKRAYYAIKDPVCDLVIDSAERWSRETRWDVPPSDA